MYHSSRDRSGRRPPPNYYSQSLQLRMLSLVGMFALVLFLMHRARDPKHYAWMGFDNNATQGQGQGATRAEQGTDTIEVNVATDLVPTNKRPGEASRPERKIPPFAGLPAVEGNASSDSENLRQQTLVHLWSPVIDLLRADDQNELDLALLCGRTGKPVPEENRVGMAEMLERLNVAWSDRLRRARQSLDTGATEPTAAELESAVILDRLDLIWQTETHPALAAAAAGTSLSADQQGHVRWFQSLLDHLALDQVQDNSTHRGAENRAWFRMLEILQSSALADVESSSQGDTSYLELFQQPTAYRGQLITVRGTAKMITRLEAPANPYGMVDYYRVVLFPAGGPPKAILVYCLELPSSFPNVDLGQDRKVDESIGITGFFFKRGVYRSEGGLQTAPMVLAKIPIWSPEPSTQTNESPGWQWLIGGSLIGLGVAAVVCWIAFRRGREPSLKAIARAARERREARPYPAEFDHQS